MIFQKMTVMQS